jgi:MYXO-CTERM domain-containing protein
MSVRSSLVLIASLSLQLCTAAHADLPQRAGWPQKIDPGTAGGYLLAPMEGVALVDLDGDGKLEIVRAAGDKLFAFDVSGKVIAGFPATLKGSGQPPPSVGDVDGDGKPEIVQVARGLKYSDWTHVHVIRSDGAEQAGWPLPIQNLLFRPATLADLDGNGALDVILQIGMWPPAGTIRVVAGDGRALGKGWEHAMDSYPISPAAVGDIDGDGQLEVAYITLGNLNVRRADGAALGGFPKAAGAGRELAGGVVLVDLDPSRAGLEIVAGEIGNGTPPQPARLLALGADGQALPGFPAALSSDASGLTPPTVGDVDNDGKLELVVGVIGQGVVIVRADGKVGAPILTKESISSSIQLVDLDGDGQLELIVDNNSWDGTDGKGFLEAYNADGSAVADFPLRPPGSTQGSGATVADLDGDGQPELIAVSTVNADPPASYISVWTLPMATSTARQWAEYGYDRRRSNCPGGAIKSTTPWKADAGPDLRPDAARVDSRRAADRSVDSGQPGGSSGCGCAVASAASPSLGALGLLGALVALRRHRPLGQRRGKC